MAELSIVAVANEQASIYQAHDIIGYQVPDYGMSVSAKLHCPFEDVYHPDSGKSYRMYPATNSTYCFACSQRFSPVLLVQWTYDLEPDAAAEKILEAIGYVMPTIDNRWDTLVNQEESIDRDGLRAALETYCQRIAPDWGSRRLEAIPSKAFDTLTGLLPKVTTAAEVEQWMSAAKRYMTKALESE